MTVHATYDAGDILALVRLAEDRKQPRVWSRYRSQGLNNHVCWTDGLYYLRAWGTAHQGWTYVLSVLECSADGMHSVDVVGDLPGCVNGREAKKHAAAELERRLQGLEEALLAKTSLAPSIVRLLVAMRRTDPSLASGEAILRALETASAETSAR
jgi:hypothetical protein